MSQRQHHWHILGAGSMGCLWAAHLALAGHRVTLLLRDRAALKAFPGYLTLQVGDRHRQVSVCAEVVTQPGEPIEQLLVAVKAPDTLAALAPLAPRLDAATPVLLMQNGMGVDEQICDAYPQLTVGIAVTTEGAYRTEAFRVVHAGRGRTWIDMNLFSLITFNFDVTAKCDIGNLFLFWDDDIKLKQWNKLAINCALNALTALLDCRNGGLLKPPGPELIRSLCEETAAVMAAEGLESKAEELTATALEVAQATGSNISSMCQDLRRGAFTEIDYINGYLLQRAAVHELDLPRHRMLVDMIRVRTTLNRE